MRGRRLQHPGQLRQKDVWRSSLRSIRRSRWNPTGVHLAPWNWPRNEEDLEAAEMVKKLACTNDKAERAVKLVPDYSSRLTLNEDQFQWALQVVERQRKLYPNANKKTLSSYRCRFFVSSFNLLCRASMVYATPC